jgi:hypothetical protein
LEFIKAKLVFKPEGTAVGFKLYGAVTAINVNIQVLK